MIKVGIITMIDNTNYGNRLQNYALNYYCNVKLNIIAYTLDNNLYLNNKENFLFNNLYYFFYYINVKVRSIIKKIIGRNDKRNTNFKLFNKNINFYKKKVNVFSKLEEFDFLIVGSDQVWNPNFGRLTDLDTLKFLNDNKKISYAASFGVSSLDEKSQKKVFEDISRFKNISVREDVGKEIIHSITFRNDVNVSIDPTLLLSSDEWKNVSKKPEQLNMFEGKKYILNYFLGELSNSRRIEIEKIAKKYNCFIINILEKEDPFYICGPSEFLYLEEHAFLICTDSFHSCVFAFLYNRPFVIFDRYQKELPCMNSRIETLLSKFKLENRKYNEKNITNKNLFNDYTEAFNILEIERKKADKYLRNSLGI